jgi:hypothetical protein
VLNLELKIHQKIRNRKIEVKLRNFNAKNRKITSFPFFPTSDKKKLIDKFFYVFFTQISAHLFTPFFPTRRFRYLCEIRKAKGTREKTKAQKPNFWFEIEF